MFLSPQEILAMSKTIESIRDTLSNDKPEEALAELQVWLAAGDRNLMKSLVSLKQNKGKSHLQGDLRRLIDQIENESPRLNKFLFHYHAANEAFEQKNWQDSTTHLQEAIDLHQPEYLALKKDLQRKLAAVSNHRKLDDLIIKGNNEYQAKYWATAQKTFLEARKHYFPGCPWSMEDFERVINNCKRAIIYSNHVDLAKEAQQTGDWEKAESEFKLALASYHADCEPALTVIQEEIRWSSSQHMAAKRDTKLEKPVYKLARKLLLPLLFTGIIGVLVWLFLQYPSWSAEPSDEKILTDSRAELPSGNIEDGLSEEIVDSSFMEAENDLIGEDFQAEEITNTLEPIKESGIAVAVPPVPSPIIAGSLVAGEEISLGINNFDQDFTYRIDYGDGRVLNGQQVQKYTYKQPGAYVLKLSVMNENGGGTSVSRRIIIKDAVGSREAADSAPKASISVSEAPVVEEKETIVSQPLPEIVEAPLPATPTPRPAPAPVTSPLDMAEVMPGFPGGEGAMISFLQSRIKYPDLAKENEVQGTVYLHFVVEADGKLSGFRLLRGLGYGCDEEALRVARLMPRWTPGKQAGVAVPVYFTVPIRFEIP